MGAGKEGQTRIRPSPQSSSKDRELVTSNWTASRSFDCPKALDKRVRCQTVWMQIAQRPVRLSSSSGYRSP